MQEPAELFDLARRAPSDDAVHWVEHFWSVGWDLRGKPPLDSAVITFPSMRVTREWGTDSLRHGHPLPASLIHGVVDRVFATTLSETGAVIGCRFRPGGFAARFARTANHYTGRVVPVDDELFDPPRRVRPGALHQRFPRHAGLRAGGVRHPLLLISRPAPAVRTSAFPSSRCRR